ncbi:hypothetical protein ACLHZ5_12670 [Aeromonas media]|uniref:hypothetical protein n=1 Tax=Aeromonas media TaxID=651 RepID=UPI003CFC019E
MPKNGAGDKGSPKRGALSPAPLTHMPTAVTLRADAANQACPDQAAIRAAR